MFLGLDVGGTHTDAVLIDKDTVVASYKAVTDQSNLLISMKKALEEVTRNIDKKKITKINLSTTLSTNAIVENRLEEVGVIISTGPGIDPVNYRIGKNYYIIPGSIDHRGRVVKDLDYDELDKSLKDCKKKGIKVYSLVTKFSIRNPDKENSLLKKVGDGADFVSLGHQLSGQLNFPRRIATAYYNSAVWRLYNSFVDSIKESIKEIDIGGEVNVLKADGGTMPLELSRKFPVETILSGPAASIMGIISLCDITEDSVILDIGGTTTDIAIFASGSPLIEREGISFESTPTLIRSLKTYSIGIGGDSIIKVDNKKVMVGPERRGPSMAEGGSEPTMTDAFNFDAISRYGDVQSSVRGINELSRSSGISAKDLVKRAVEYAINRIKDTVEEILRDINEKPVYTIHEMLENKIVVPGKIYVMGGPAENFAPFLSASFGKEVIIPKNYAVANAIGAAVARSTFNLELFADTNRGVAVVPNLNIKKEIPKDYTLEAAEEDSKRYLLEYLSHHGFDHSESDVEIVESSSFKMVQGFFSIGKDIRVKGQMKPGVTEKIRS